MALEAGEGDGGVWGVGVGVGPQDDEVLTIPPKSTSIMSFWVNVERRADWLSPAPSVHNVTEEQAVKFRIANAGRKKRNWNIKSGIGGGV